MTSTIDINAGELLQKVSVDIRLTGLKVVRARLWLAALLIKFAGVVGGCDIRAECGRDFDDLPPLPRTRSYVMVGGAEVPRQASVRHGSPLYTDPTPWGRSVDFYLDGVRQDRVVSYDLDAGYMRVHKLGPDGQAFVAGDEIATEILRGEIEARPARQ